MRHFKRDERIARRLEEPPALFGHAETARRSLQQPHTELPLQPLHIAADRDRRDTELSRGRGQAARIYRSYEGDDTAQTFQGASILNDKLKVYRRRCQAVQRNLVIQRLSFQKRRPLSACYPATAANVIDRFL